MWQSSPHFEHTRCKYWMKHTIVIIIIIIIIVVVIIIIITHKHTLKILYKTNLYPCNLQLHHHLRNRNLSTTTSRMVAKISSGILAFVEASKVAIKAFTLA